MHSGIIQQLAPPTEVYRRPVNRFVAAFVGSPAMNFLDGRLTVTGGEPGITLTNGTKVGLSGYGFAKQPQEGQAVVLGVRPEQINFKASEMPQASKLPLKVSLIDPMGADSLVWGTVGTDTISVRVEDDEGYKLGENLDAFFLPQQASLFDIASGDRL